MRDIQLLFILFYKGHLKWLRNVEQKLIVIKYFNTITVQLLGEQGMTTTWNAPAGEIVSILRPQRESSQLFIYLKIQVLIINKIEN